ncbi:MAG: YicC family protein [Clostridiales bacterium]|nr:YicC family protein [Clostridiales bacterium]
MKSMTGYGKGVAVKDKRTVTVEIKSVNNRFLEIACKLPKSLMYIDDIIQKCIKAYASRGSFDVYFSYVNLSDSAKKVTVDKALAAEYVAAAKTLRAEFMLEDDYNVTALLRTPDVASVTVPDDDRELVAELTKQAVSEALDNLNKMRKVEGDGVYVDLMSLICNLEEYLKKAIARAPQVVADYKTSLLARVKELLDGYEPDEGKLLNEVAFFADKADINEEISRLSSHIGQFKAICAEKDTPQGRRLDFLSQEMVREVNTMGSKSNDITLTGFVIGMKNEVEKIKEQIRNVE